MKKRDWIILIIIFIVVDLIIFYIFSPYSPAQNVPGIFPEQGRGNETQTSWKFPNITLPGSSGSESSGAGEGSGGTEGGAGGEGSETNVSKVKVNYTLFIDSSFLTPGLTVLTNYSVNDVILNTEQVTPYSVEVWSDTYACVILSQFSGSGVIGYEVDGEDCEPSFCFGFVGCTVFMDKSHSVIVSYTPANVTG